MTEITLTPEAEALRESRMTFGAQIRDLMKLSDMSVDELAKASGVKASKIIAFRGSSVMPKVLDAVAIAKALGVSVELLITGEEA